MSPQTIDLNLASNMLGPLGGEVRARLVAAIQRPCEETWDDAYSIILNRESWLTLWQAVMAIDPTFPKSGPVTRWVEDRRRHNPDEDQTVTVRVAKHELQTMLMAQPISGPVGPFQTETPDI